MVIKNVARIVTDKVDSKYLSKTNYISTENMLPNFAGITHSSSVSTAASTAYKVDDVLISNIRPYFRKIWLARFDGGCSNDVICLRVTSANCLPKYLFYLLNTDKFIDTFVASSKGTKMPRGDKQALLEYNFDIHPLTEQQHIVDLIGSLDDKIENNEKIMASIDHLVYQMRALIQHIRNACICLEIMI